MRLFIAIPLPKSTEQHLAEIIRTLRKPNDGIKWVDSRNIHLTLRFLGDTDENLVPTIQRGIAEAAKACHAVSCKLVGVGAFPNLHRPRVIWIGFENGIDALKNMALELEQRMRALGFAPETKAFKPHLTLGRVREGAPPVILQMDAIARLAQPDFVSLDKFVLFQSTLTPQGPIYKALFAATFNGIN